MNMDGQSFDGRRSRHVLPACSSVLAAVSCLAVLLVPASARADRNDDDYGHGEVHGHLNLGLDLESAIPMSMPQFISGNSLSDGGGFKIRVGDQFRMAGLRIIPEGGYAFDHLFASDDTGAAYAWDLHRLFGGVRVGFGRILVPVVYADVGYGWRDTGDPTVSHAGGLALNGGFALDLHVVSHFGFGAHVEYAVVDAQPYAAHWLALGLHADVAL